MADVFVSYAREDRDVVERLAELLKARGHSVWWDRELLGGDDFSELIERELTGAGTVIVGWSAEGVQSRWVKDEAAVAADAGKLITVSLDGIAPPLGFRQFHAIDLSSWGGDPDAAPIADLLRTVKLRLAGASPSPSPRSSPLPSPPPAPAPRGDAATDTARTVAVLPFVNRSPQAEDAFFADGVHDELLTRIAKISAIRVISRTSVMRYRDTVLPIPQIARELGAAVVLEGAVQRAGSRVRINVQLIDGRRDTHLWAENFDRELTPDMIFDIQAEITREIAAQLKAALTGSDEAALDQAAPTRSLTAYDAYLRGQLLARSEAAGEKDARAAIAAFDEAIAADPAFGQPHAGKARAQLTLYWFFGWDRDWVTAAARSVDRAVALAPDAVETLLARAYFHYWGELNYPDAEAALNEVLARAPNNAEAWACKAYVVRRAGRFAESIEALEKARQLNPMLIDLPMELATTLATFGRFDEANRYMARVRTLDAKSAFTAYYAGDVGYMQGDPALAWAGASHTVDEPDFVYCYRRAFHSLQTRDAACMDEALARWPTALHRTASFPATFEIYEAMVSDTLGRDEETASIVAAVHDDLSRLPDPYPGGWTPDAPYFPVTLAGLMRDRDAVHAAAQTYDRDAPLDEFGKVNHYHAIAAAYARCGDADQALDYLERLLGLFGPCAYLPISITPAYDGLREHPRYRALRQTYEAWARR